MHTTRVAGAERVVGDVRRFIESSEGGEFKVDLATLRDSAGIADQRRLGLATMLFGNYDVIHSHLFLPGLALRLRRLFDRRFVWVHTVHYVNYEGQTWPRLKRLLDRHFIFSAADQLVAVSPSVFSALSDFQNKTLIENQIALRSDQIESHRTFVEGELVIGAMAMLRPEKGIDDLIEAHRLLLLRGEAVRLKIAGDGPELQRLQQRVRDLSLQDTVDFLGYVAEPQQFFRSIDVFVNSSKTESFGLAMLEAFQFSVPVIAASVGHSPELLQGGRFGRLVARDELFVVRLADEIQTARAQLTARREQSAAGLRHYLSTMSSEAMPKAYLALYQRLLRPGVCMISPIVTQATGGIQRQILLQSRELDRRGYRVFILQRRDRHLAKYLAQDQQRWSHVTFLSTPDFGENQFHDSPFLTKLRGLAFVVLGIFAVARFRQRIQILHAHQLYSPSLIAFAAKKLFGMVTVVKVTASGIYGEYQQLQKLPFFKLRKWTFQSLDRVVVLTEDMQSEVRQLGLRPSQISLVPNSVENQPEIDTALPLKASFSRLEVLFCGRLSKEKSLDTLIKALVLLAHDGVSSRLRLVGGDHGGRADSEHLRSLCAQLPDDVEVEFSGHQENVRPFYLSSDVFVLPSLSEGMSNSLLEAMAYGLVCIVSDIPANTFVIQNGVNGLHFRCADAIHLKNQLRNVADDLAKNGEISDSISKNAQATIAERFSVQSVGARLSEIYESHLSKKHFAKQANP